MSVRRRLVSRTRPAAADNVTDRNIARRPPRSGPGNALSAKRALEVFSLAPEGGRGAGGEGRSRCGHARARKSVATIETVTTSMSAAKSSALGVGDVAFAAVAGL